MKHGNMPAWLTLLPLSLCGILLAKDTAEELEHDREIKLMQQIEPGFVPKDERAVRLFMLQKSVADNEEALKTKEEERIKLRSLLGKRHREELLDLTAKKSNMLSQKLDELLDEAIKREEMALNDYPQDPHFAAHALYNLGRYYFDQDEKSYIAKLAHYSEAQEKGQQDVPYPEENFSRTIETYQRLIKEYPDFPKMVDVYYLLGLALWYEGAFDSAKDKFDELVKQFPKSRFVDEVWFRLGEFYYDMDDYYDAIKAYRKVSANEKSQFYVQATYKIAWSYFQIDQYMESLRGFIKVIELTPHEAGRAASGMRAEALRYVVKNFSEELLVSEAGGQRSYLSEKVGKLGEKEYEEALGIRLTETISQYFKALGNPPYLREVLLETASQLLDESKIDGAVLALEKIIELDPTSQDNPRIASQIIEILEEANRNDEARERGLALLETYSKTSPWYLAQKDNPKAQKYAREAVRDAMLTLAVQYHKAGKERKKEGDIAGADKDFLAAATLYRNYVEEFPEREDTYKAIFYFAESSYEMNHFRAALDAYTLLKNYPLPLPDGMRRDAVFNIVFTFRHVIEEEAKEHRFKDIDFDHLTSKSRGAEPEEIPEIGLRYLAAIDEFLKLAPKDERVPVLLFHAAAIYYVYGHSDEAMSRFLYIIDTYPNTQAAKVAARLVIDDAVAKEDWPKVIELAKRFKAENLDEGKGDFARIEGNARFKMARTVFEQAAKLKEENQLAEAKVKYREAAALFLTLLKEDPTNPYADVMLFNSARAIAESGTTTEALPLYRELYTKYPKSEYAKVARFQEALALEKMLKFADAAKAYDAIIKLDPKSETAADAMLNQALLYEADEDFARAATAYLNFAKSYPEKEEAPEALLAAASLYKKMGEKKQQIAMLEQFVRQYHGVKGKLPAVIEAHVHIGDTYGELAKATKSKTDALHYQKLRLTNYRAAVSLYHPDLASALAAFFAAKALLALEEPEQDAFRNLRITAKSGKGQAQQMTAMMKELTKLKEKDENIIRHYAQAVSNAEAMRRIGALYQHLAKAMVRAPCPEDVERIDEFACDEYIVLLEDKAAILEKKAFEAYKEAYDIASSSYDAPSDLVDKILLGLNAIKPGEYQRVGNLVDRPQSGAVYGEGRMLSTGKMASSLHPQEADPDIKREVVPKEPLENAPHQQGEPKGVE